jgi:transcriptional regulator with XRE-family HTH domain
MGRKRVEHKPVVNPETPRGDLPLVKAIKKAIREAGVSVYQVSRRSGVSQAQLSRFLHDDRTLRLDIAAKLFEALGLEVVQRKKPNFTAKS